MPTAIDPILKLRSTDLLNGHWTVQEAIVAAGILEAASPKLGNVHPGAAFSDMTFDDFVASSFAIADALSASGNQLGRRCLLATEAMVAASGTNPHLGTILLLAPLAMAAECPPAESCTPTRLGLGLRLQTSKVLSELSSADSAEVYQAIRLAKPGGLGDSQEHDVHREAPANLITAMAAAADRDLVARQYTNSFADVFGTLLPLLRSELERCPPLVAISRFQVRALAWHADSLIARKTSWEQAVEIQDRAKVLERALADSPGSVPSQRTDWQDLDAHMRRHGNSLNPGTIADLIGATLLVLMMDRH